VGGVSEWLFNRSEIAPRLHAKLRMMGHSPAIYHAYAGDSYEAAMIDIAGRLNRDKMDVALELHFNSAHAGASGHEWLYWNSSARSKALATWLDETFDDVAPLPSRGLLPRFRSNRGALFLRLTHCPAVICEPFFGSNAQDWAWASANPDVIATCMAKAIHCWSLEVGKP